jgi:hypothetical protein
MIKRYKIFRLYLSTGNIEPFGEKIYATVKEAEKDVVEYSHVELIILPVYIPSKN